MDITKEEARKRVDIALADARKVMDEAKEFIKVNGLEYGLDDWVTIKTYCERFEIKNTQTVSKWIMRGKVPPENVITVKELNDLKLIKAIPY